MRLWILDADVIIDLLSLDLFDALVNSNKVYVASSVINEVHFFRKGPRRYAIDMRKSYLLPRLIEEHSASAEEIKEIGNQLSGLKAESFHFGELESLAILKREREIVLCSCDAAAIRALPSLGLSERGISVESLLRRSGLLKPGLQERHTDQYFKNNLSIGRLAKIYQFNPSKDTR